MLFCVFEPQYNFTHSFRQALELSKYSVKKLSNSKKSVYSFYGIKKYDYPTHNQYFYHIGTRFLSCMHYFDSFLAFFGVNIVLDLYGSNQRDGTKEEIQHIGHFLTANILERVNDSDLDHMSAASHAAFQLLICL